MLTCNDYVAQIQQKISQIEAADLDELDNKIIIDIREPDEAEKGIIPHAIRIPRGVLESKLDSLVTESYKATPAQFFERYTLVLYCRSGARSALAAHSLSQMGIPNVVSLRGGILAWQSQR
jgi:rhodanese-related sulfurtransferase